jgi:NIMA (never in mitosis gene a)-related kinase
MVSRIVRIKTHKANVTAREDELRARESAIFERENQLQSILVQKDVEVASLQQMVATAEDQHRKVVELRVNEAVARREEELRVLVMNHQREVSAAMVKREEELLEAVKRREEEVRQAWFVREQEVRDEMASAVEERMEWVRKQMEEVEEERRKLEATREEVENKVKAISESTTSEKKSLFFIPSFLARSLMCFQQAGKRERILKKSRTCLLR